MSGWRVLGECPANRPSSPHLAESTGLGWRSRSRMWRWFTQSWPKLGQSIFGTLLSTHVDYTMQSKLSCKIFNVFAFWPEACAARIWKSSDWSQRPANAAKSLQHQLAKENLASLEQHVCSSVRVLQWRIYIYILFNIYIYIQWKQIIRVPDHKSYDFRPASLRTPTCKASESFCSCVDGYWLFWQQSFSKGFPNEPRWSHQDFGCYRHASKLGDCVRFRRWNHSSRQAGSSISFEVVTWDMDVNLKRLYI